jgi:hypothetical protein
VRENNGRSRQPPPTSTTAGLAVLVGRRPSHANERQVREEDSHKKVFPMKPREIAHALQSAPPSQAHTMFARLMSLFADLL